ncbi:hypothetical protein CPB86DRAFT_533708 [Serendipita vermifera]|nr:hypothetical protein CPB86DRAFT_533708 [Serendipita vermifera]
MTTAPTTPPPTTTRPTGSTIPDTGTDTFVTSITTKPTDVNNPTQPGGPNSPTPGSPSDTDNQNPTGTLSNGETGQGPNQSGIGGETGANTDSEGGTPTQGPHSGSDNPTQTAGPIRNTQQDERPTAKMSKQALGAIIGTTLSAVLLFLAFLIFRWHRRHKKKHDPHPILPRSASDESTGNIMTRNPGPPVPPPVTIQTLDLQTEMTDASPITPRSMDPLTPSSRRIPNSKQRSLFPYASRLSDDGTESIPPSVVDTGTAPLSESIILDASDVSQEHEVDANDGLHPPGGPAQPASPVSLQHLINRELEHLLTDPDTQSYWNSLTSPPSPSYDLSSYGLGAQSGPTLASTSKVPYGPPPVRQNTSSHYTTDRTSLAPPSPSSTGSHQLRLSRQDMDVLADLVAARITRGQRPGHLQPRLQPHQEQQPEGGPGPPPSYA